MIIHDGNDIPELEQAQDPNAAIEYTFIMRPEVWQADTIYYEKQSVIVPSTFNGFYYLAISGGKSAAAEPSFPCVKGSIVEDGCVKWKAFPYNLYLRPGKNITSAVWSSNISGVTISAPVTTNDKTTAIVSSIPSSVSQVKITIHFTYSNGEEDDRSFIIPVEEL